MVARILRQEGSKNIFGLHGGHIDPIFQACRDEDIRIIDTRHEQAAGHMADAWGRLTGRPGVAVVTAGPGVTDIVTAVANAYLDCVPMVVIGGRHPVVDDETMPLQELHGLPLMQSITKWSRLVRDTHRIPEYLAAACRQATTGRPGPAFLEIPADVLAASVDEEAVAWPARSEPAARPMPSAEATQAALAMLAQAERPLIPSHLAHELTGLIGPGLRRHLRCRALPRHVLLLSLGGNLPPLGEREQTLQLSINNCLLRFRKLLTGNSHHRRHLRLSSLPGDLRGLRGYVLFDRPFADRLQELVRVLQGQVQAASGDRNQIEMHVDRLLESELNDVAVRADEAKRSGEVLGDRSHLRTIIFRSVRSILRSVLMRPVAGGYTEMQAPDHRLKSDDHTVGTFSQTSRQYNIALQGRFMPEVIIGSSASFEQGLKQFNKLVQLSGILREARQRQYFEPPSVVRKRKAATKLRKSLKAARLESGRGLKYGAAKRKPGPAVKTRR